MRYTFNMHLLYLHTGILEKRRANVIQVLQMCKAFSDLGTEVTLQIASDLDEGEAEAVIKDILDIETVPFRFHTSKTIRFSPKINSVLQALCFRRLCRSSPHDYVFLRNPICLPLVFGCANRIIFESHNNLCVLNASWLDRILRRKVISLSKSTKLALFIGISSALTRWWQEQGVPADKLIALHDAVDPDKFALDIDKSTARQKTGLPDGRPIVLYAGSLYKDRNIQDILALAANRTDARFVIVGGPEPSRLELEKEAKNRELENVIFTGPVPYRSVPLYLAAADVLLMLWSKDVPTINYCSPLKVFEYMAAGRIIVGHRFPTIEEVLTDGEGGYLADPDSFNDLARCLHAALSANSADMAIRARKIALSEYTWKKRCSVILSKLSIPVLP